MASERAEWDIEAMRTFSRLVFGSPHRLPVAVLSAGADPEDLYAARIASLARTDTKEVRRLLSGLQAAHVLEPVELPRRKPGKGNQPKYLSRCDERFWAAVQELGSRYRRMPPGASS